MNREARFIVVNSLLTFLSLSIWLFALRESNLNIGNFGLIESLSPFFFVALALLLISFFMNLELKISRNLMLVQTFLLVLFLFLTPTLIEGTARFRSTYKVYGFIEYVTRNGYLNPQDIVYHNWPGSIVLFSIFQELINSKSSNSIFMYYPFFIEILYLVPLYVFLNKFYIESEKKWLGIWIFYILNFLNQDYLSPQSICYFLFMILLIIYATSLFGKNPSENWSLGNFKFRIIFILLFIFIVISHVLTALNALLMLLALTALTYLNRKPLYLLSDDYSQIEKNKNVLFLLIFCSVAFLSWQAYGAILFLNENLANFIMTAFDLESVLHNNLNARVAGFIYHILISQLMIGSAIISYGLATLAIIWSRYNNDNRSTSMNFNLIILFISTLAVLPIYSYGGELFIRVFLFSLPFLAFIIPQLYDKQFKTLLLLFILLMAPLHIITHYGNEKYDYVPMGEVVSHNFFYENSIDKYISGGSTLSWDSFQEKYMRIDFDHLIWNGNKYLISDNLGILNKYNYFIVISYGDIIRYKFYFNDNTFIKNIEDNINNNYYVKLYDDNDVHMFRG